MAETSPNCPRRLSANDLELIEAVAAQMIAAGLWQAVQRSSDPSCDCFEITRDDTQHSTVIIGVLPTGRRFCMDNRTSAVHLAPTLAEVLDQAGLLPVAVGSCLGWRSTEKPSGFTRNQ